MDSFREWYRAPLSGNDVLAGGLLVVLFVLFTVFYGLVMVVLWNASKEIIGFRYLLSSAVADILCMVQYGLLDGIAILTKSPLVGVEGRSLLQLYMDWVWFACCFHLPLIAWSRLHAIYAPHSFREQKQWMSYAVCGGLAWLLSLVICCATHWQPFYVRFYFEPAVYGMLADDFPKYQKDGHSHMFVGIHILVVVLPIVFYSLTIALLIKHRSFVGAVQPEKGSRRQSVETKLIVPCILGTIVFVIGQVAITIGTGSGPWATWTICFLFFLNSALQPVLLVMFSPFLRNGVLTLLSVRRPARKSTLFAIPPYRTTIVPLYRILTSSSLRFSISTATFHESTLISD
ncbi:hypothetical protein PRIPAC_72145 [Pristionchus pacificus]|uniref:G protein-coupled receptor n=1 Tax=Pristionchus pacificus TaxID=54126 RepID=A0A2A6BZB2_PRIPA|nr:hypothetical protein PRIPAC_72145 [Pristionchus pacificus]|eukprot:PDM71342.1 G protein-coupled receptor [Pristionchus pacificus]